MAQERQLFAPGEGWEDHDATERSAHDPATATPGLNEGSFAVKQVVEIDPVAEWHKIEYAFAD